MPGACYLTSPWTFFYGETFNQCYHNNTIIIKLKPLPIHRISPPCVCPLRVYGTSLLHITSSVHISPICVCSFDVYVPLYAPPFHVYLPPCVCSSVYDPPLPPSGVYLTSMSTPLRMYHSSMITSLRIYLFSMWTSLFVYLPSIYHPFSKYFFSTYTIFLRVTPFLVVTPFYM